jgi:hypothetical protein
MRTISLALVSILSLGVALAGGRAIAGERASHSRNSPLKTESAQPSLVPAGRLWYGGTLAPILVEGVAPVRLVAHTVSTCSTGGR